MGTAFREHYGYTSGENGSRIPLWRAVPEANHLHDVINGNVTYRFIRYDTTAAVFVGTNLPSETECFRFLGTPDAILAAPYTGDLADFTPKCTTFDLNYSDTVSDGYVHKMCLTDISFAQVEELIAAAEAMGFYVYERADYQGEADTCYYHGLMPLLNVEIQIAYYKDNLAVYLAAFPGRESQEDMWENVMRYSGTANGHPQENTANETPGVNLGENENYGEGEEVVNDDAYALEQFLLENLPGVPVQKGSGTGIEISAGIVYNFCTGAASSDFNSMMSRLRDQGFSEDSAVTRENDTQVFVAWKSAEFYGKNIRLYTKLIYDGGYLEVQIGTNGDQPSHKGAN
jgi:hypothetical protein